MVMVGDVGVAVTVHGGLLDSVGSGLAEEVRDRAPTSGGGRQSDE